jgi:hypothetical protein
VPLCAPEGVIMGIKLNLMGRPRCLEKYEKIADLRKVFGKVDVFEGEGMWCKITLKDVRIIHGVLKNKGVI